MEDSISYFERMLAENPDNPTGLLTLANEYGKAERYEAAVLKRHVATHDHERTARQHIVQFRFRAELIEDGVERVEVVSA